ncbi:MAG: hypothetical protein RI995_810, partial [Bacteroidota bacterium]
MMQQIQSLWSSIGEWHPLVVHFPISLPFILGLLEIISIKKGREEFQSTARILLGVSVATALLAIVLGLLLYWKEGDEGLLIQKHLWTGISSGLFLVFALIAHFYQEIKSYRIFLGLSIISVSVAGYFGGEYVRLPEEVVNTNDVRIQETTHVKEFSDSLVVLRNQAHDILHMYCVDCHGTKKSKGRLRLDQLEYALKGGKNGPALVLGNAAKSEMIRRIKLPKDDDDAMPTKGKRPTAAEIKLLEDWINAESAKSNKTKNKLSVNKVQSRAILDDWIEPPVQPVVNSKLSEEQIVELNIKVRSILAHSCYSCHNATKT